VSAILQKVTSRKLWVAVSTILGLLSQHQYAAAAAVASVYIAAEAHVDKAKAAIPAFPDPAP
jgi:predicted membrane protein